MSYRTEEEQLESIRNWWKRHSSALMLVFSLVLLGFSGYKYWNWHQEKILSEASNAYEQMMIAFSNQNNKAVKAYAHQIINNYSQTVYADVARMTLAKLFVEKNKYSQAKKALTEVAYNSKMAALKQVAKIRIARLLLVEKGYEGALQELAVLDDKAYMPLINELKGDIYAATGHFQQAILSYKEAISEVGTHGMGNLFLEMKTNELAAMTKATIFPPAKVEAA